MTKVIILGQEELKKELKKIEFVKKLRSDLEIDKELSEPYQYKNIELVCRNYGFSCKDLMFAYLDNRNDGILYIGYFNDGVV